MTDPSDALASFQQALLDGQIQLQQGAHDRNLFVHSNRPDGVTRRLTYVRLNRQTVAALAMFVMTEPLDGLPCFHIGYAVPEAYRGNGHAKSIVESSIAELKHGLLRNNISTFYVEAIVGTDNKASNRVAVATISATPVAVTDELSGLPAFQYVRKV
jgi:RimJ/RimL family protein N-acetyltransferase